MRLSRQSVNRMVLGGMFKTLHMLGERPIYVIRREELDELKQARAARHAS